MEWDSRSQNTINPSFSFLVIYSAKAILWLSWASTAPCLCCSMLEENINFELSGHPVLEMTTTLLSLTLLKFSTLTSVFLLNCHILHWLSSPRESLAHFHPTKSASLHLYLIFWLPPHYSELSCPYQFLFLLLPSHVHCTCSFLSAVSDSSPSKWHSDLHRLTSAPVVFQFYALFSRKNFLREVVCALVHFYIPIISLPFGIRLQSSLPSWGCSP